MLEDIGDSLFWAVIQSFIVFAVAYLVSGLVDPEGTDVGFVLRFSIGWFVGAFVGRLVSHRLFS